MKTIKQLEDVIIWRMVNGVLPKNFGNLDVLNETDRQKELLKEYKLAIQKEIKEINPRKGKEG